MFHRFVHAVISRRSAVAVMLASAAFMAVLSGPPAFAQGTPPVPAADLASPGAVAREGYALTPPAAEALEATLRTNPNDLAARTKLLGFYFRQGGRTVAGCARRPGAAGIFVRTHLGHRHIARAHRRIP